METENFISKKQLENNIYIMSAINTEDNLVNDFLRQNISLDVVIEKELFSNY